MNLHQTGNRRMKTCADSRTDRQTDKQTDRQTMTWLYSRLKDFFATFFANYLNLQKILLVIQILGKFNEDDFFNFIIWDCVATIMSCLN